MAHFLRQVIAAPRVQHQDTGLDLCYVTENIIATYGSFVISNVPSVTRWLTLCSSGPTLTYPKRAYRTPLEHLVKFLDRRHGENWAIWEFRAEGTGYPDEAVYGRIHHFPWPDHHPPPFRFVPLIMGSMRNWMHGGELKRAVTPTGGDVQATDDTTANPTAPVGVPVAPAATETTSGVIPATSVETAPESHSGAPTGTASTQSSTQPNPDRVIVVHCKAGKGRSGSMATSYLISQCGWEKADALKRFTERRMLPGFGSGVSIPSQLRYIDYVERWTKAKRYVDRPAEILEVRCYGLRNGVTIDINGFSEEGKKIRRLHSFSNSERQIREGNPPGGKGHVDMLRDMFDGGVDKEKQEAVTNSDITNKTHDASTTTPTGSKKQLLTNVAKAIGRMMPSSPSLNKTPVPMTADSAERSSLSTDASSQTAAASDFGTASGSLDKETPGGRVVVFRPLPEHAPIVAETSDVQVAIERKSRAGTSTNIIGSKLAVTTSVAHVWFNIFFEGLPPLEVSNGAEEPATSGTFRIEWHAMDGFKGGRRKGSRALDYLEVDWRAHVRHNVTAGTPAAEYDADEIREPMFGQPVKEPGPADWRGEKPADVDPGSLKVPGNFGHDDGEESSNDRPQQESTTTTVDRSEPQTSESAVSNQGSGIATRLDPRLGEGSQQH